jgi:hypothetical protein
MDNDRKYLIGFSFKDNIVALIFLAIFTAVSVAILLSNNKAVAMVLGLFVLLLFVLNIILFYRMLFKKILFDRSGFIHKSSPFKSEYYEDSQIKNAWIDQKPRTNGTMVYSFCFKTREGKIGKVEFPPYRCDYAQYLVDRIQGEDVSEYVEHLDLFN